MDTLPFPRTARNCAMSAESEMFLGVYQKTFFYIQSTEGKI
jgi:hypothetical protein